MTAKIWGVAALLTFVAGAPMGIGQDVSDPEIQSLQARARKFLDALARGDAQTAYPELLTGSPLRAQTKAIDDLIERTRQLEGRYGKHLESEPIAPQRLGKDLALIRFLYKCEEYPVVFYFTFYRPPHRELPSDDDAWRVISVRFDSEIELLALAVQGGTGKSP